MEVSRVRSDLEERTFNFARDVRRFVGRLPRNNVLASDAVQLVRSSGSIGANYLEAQEAMSRKDFGMRIKISRKEAKETRYWLGLLEGVPLTLADEHIKLHKEATELLKILSAIVEKLRA